MYVVQNRTSVKETALTVPSQKQSILVQAKAAAKLNPQTVPSRLAVIVNFK
jgi:hypothetical protein